MLIDTESNRVLNFLHWNQSILGFNNSIHFLRIKKYLKLQFQPKSEDTFLFITA